MTLPNKSRSGSTLNKSDVWGYGSPRGAEMATHSDDGTAAAVETTDITKVAEFLVKTISTISWTTMIPWSHRLGFYFHGFAIALKLKKRVLLVRVFYC